VETGLKNGMKWKTHKNICVLEDNSKCYRTYSVSCKCIVTDGRKVSMRDPIIGKHHYVTLEQKAIVIVDLELPLEYHQRCLDCSDTVGWVSRRVSGL